MKHRYALEFDVCGVLVELPIEYDYDYHPPEPETPDYPGCPFELTLTGVWLEGVNIQDRLDPEQRRAVRTKAMENEGLI